MNKLLVLSFLSVIFLFTACESDSLIQPQDDAKLEIENQDPDGAAVDHSDHPAHGHEDHICDHMMDQGFYNLDDIEVIDFEFPDGKVEKRYRLGGDVVLTKEELQELKGITDQVGMRQYRTWNLVSNNQTITVLGYTGGSYALTPKMRTALQWAINNYNALNIGLNFSLSFGTNFWTKDIVVYKVNNGQAGGQAGFPSGGNPYKWVQIFSGMENYSYNVNEHVMTHEIGHCLGLRHTDYFNRASCGQNSNEGSAGVGAVHVPGTPTGIDWNSVMLACFSTSENGEFGFYDRVALEYLY